MVGHRFLGSGQTKQQTCKIIFNQNQQELHAVYQYKEYNEILLQPFRLVI